MIKTVFPLKNLLSFRKPEDVAKFLEILEKEEYSWRDVGDDATNFPRLAISKSGVRAIIERITNSIDAILENQKDMRQDSLDDKIKSPREAIEKWFGVKGGHISFLTDNERRKIARDSIEVILDDSGIEKTPTVTIKDRGIGIHPDEFPKTVVGLGGSLKRGKPHLLGAYGWGGSQTFIWCNGALKATDVKSLPLAIIVSRKNPKVLTNGQRDEVGWTIVRYRDNPDEKHGVFQYLVDSNKNVPRTSLGNSEDFHHGTQITHLAYDMEKFHGRMTLASYRLFQSLLFDPALPFWLYDNRFEDGRTISGNLSRLNTDEKSIVEYSNTGNQVLQFGTLKIRYWALKTKKDGGFHIESYLERPGSPNTIFITLNGQQYGTLSKQIIKDAGFSFLSDFLIFQIECDSLPVHAKKSIFPSTREDIRDEYKEIFKNEIISILQNDDELKKLEDARKQESLASGDEESIKRIRRLLDKLISVNKRIIEGGGKGEKEKKNKFKFRDPPTKLIILPEHRNLEVVPGDEKKVTIETDAPNDLLTRDENAGSIDCWIDDPELKCTVRSGFLRNGKINFYIFVDSNVPIGIRGKLCCKLEIPNITKLEDSKTVEVISSPPPLPSNYPPTIFEILNEDDPLNIKRGKKSLVQIRCDGPDGLLELPENRAVLNISFLPYLGIRAVGISDLSRHRIRIFLQCPQNIDIGKRTEIFCRLDLPDKSAMTAKRACIVTLPPPSDGGEEGSANIEIPNYEVIPVSPDDKNWITFQWDESDVGIYKKSGDSLLLYVSLGNKKYLNSLDHKDLPTEKVKAFKEKYLAYIGFHLWLVSEERDSENGLSDERIKSELKRICQTVLLTLDQDSQFR